MDKQEYFFGIEPYACTDLYSDEKRYGFVTEDNRREQKLLQLPELNSGFDTVYWYRDQNITDLHVNQYGCFQNSELIREKWNLTDNRVIPLTFKCKVPETGNYRVTVSIDAGEKEIKEFCLFAQCRRLLYRGSLQKGEQFKQSFLVNTGVIIPRGQEKVFTDQTIDITLTGEYVSLKSIEVSKVNCPTIFIAGDSTVTDQSTDYPYAPGTSYAGWGQMLGAYIEGDYAVSNHAHSGLTTESFRSEGHYDAMCTMMKEGDYCLFQFAHNDQKLSHLKADEGYRKNLLIYIEETRAKGVIPVLVTPLARNSWKGSDGTYNDLLAAYAEECILIGKQLQVPVIDLHAYSAKLIQKLGMEAAKQYFFPGDYTHSNDYGAYKMAGVIARGLGSMETKAITIAQDRKEWTPKRPFELSKIPEELAGVENPFAEEDLFPDLERPTANCTRVEALDMVIKMAKFFPTNVYNDMFTDVVGHEWYAGSVECAYQNGMIVSDMIENQEFRPLEEVTLQDFIVFLINGYKSRKSLPEEIECPMDTEASDYARPYVRAAYQLGVLDDNWHGTDRISRERAADMCRQLRI